MVQVSDRNVSVRTLTPGIRKEHTMTKIIIALMIIPCLILGGCAGMSQTEQRTLSGGAIGAAGGAIIGAIAGSAGLGAAIGGAVGAGGGGTIF